MMKMYWQFKIKSIAEKASADNKRINGAMISEYCIPYSGKTILQTTEQKNTSRSEPPWEIKSKYRAFEKIQVDIKYLDESSSIHLSTSFRHTA